MQQLPACVKAQSQLHQQDLEESTLIQQLTTRQAERFRTQPERTTFTWSVGGTLIFVELAALEGPDLQNSTVAGQNLGVGYFSAPETGQRRHAYGPLSRECPAQLEPVQGRVYGPQEEPERYPNRYVMNYGQLTPEEHQAELRQAAQAVNTSQWDSARRRSRAR